MTPPDGGIQTTGIIGALAMDANGSARSSLTKRPFQAQERSPRTARATSANLSPIRAAPHAGMSKTSIDFRRPSSPPPTTRGSATSVGDRRRGDDQRDQICRRRLPVVIADGHHRYQTSLTFQRERRRRRLSDVAGDFDLVMAMVVELSDEELAVGPVHRILSGCRRLRSGGRLLLMGRRDASEQVHAADNRRAGGVSALALVMPSSVWLLSPKDGTARRPVRTSIRRWWPWSSPSCPARDGIPLCVARAVAVVDSEQAQATVLAGLVTLNRSPMGPGRATDAAQEQVFDPSPAPAWSTGRSRPERSTPA